MTNTAAPINIKEKLRKRYKRCRICKTKDKKITFHHLIAGLHEDGNLVPLCEDCHKKVHKEAATRIGKAISSGIRQGIKDILYNKFQNGKIMIQQNDTQNNIKTEIMNSQVLRNKFADLQKEVRKEFQRLENEIKEKTKEEKNDTK